MAGAAATAVLGVAGSLPVMLGAGGPILFSRMGLSLRYPAHWTANTTPVVTMFSTNIVFLSNEAAQVPCEMGLPQPPACLAGLAPGGIYVDWDAGGRPGLSLRGRRLEVGGVAAGEIRWDGRGYCPLAHVQRSVYLLALTQGFNGYEMVACLRGPGLRREEAEVAQMISSVRIAGH